MQRIRTSATLALFLAPGIFGQTDAPLTFNAVSIKPAQPGARGSGYNTSPGRLNGKNDTLRDLVKFAYGLHDYQLTGGPAWQDTERYDVVANYSRPFTDAERKVMMQAMLADRFHLEIHRESKEISGYALVVDKNGVKFHAAEAERPSLMLDRDSKTGQRRLTGERAAMSSLASILSELMARPVEDKTGLPGIFDFVMEWTPDDSQPGLRIPEKESDDPNAPSGPPIQMALQETLGLRLKTQKAPMEVVVIDRAEKPSEN